LGFQYFGPFDGHNLRELIEILEKIQPHHHPVLVHVITQKGKGFDLTEKDPTKYHGVAVRSTGAAKLAEPSPQSYTQVFSEALLKEAEINPKVVAITAAMAEGTGLVEFGHRFPDRFFDVGIAEGHAVTFAGGLAAEGLRPVCAIYSTFLQRAFDHMVHDVALQRLPVVFAVDRAGLVGEDGPTHHGVLDLTYLSAIPNMVVAAPKDGRELKDLLHTALSSTKGPFAIRFPRGRIPDDVERHAPSSVRIGSWVQLTEGRDIAVLAVGSMVGVTLDAARELSKDGIEVSVVNCRFVKPIDEAMLQTIARASRYIVTVEENTGIGGFASAVARYLAGTPESPRLLSLHLPDRFVGHGARAQLLERVGLSKDSLRKVLGWLATGDPSIEIDELEAVYDFVAALKNGVVRKVKESA